MRKALRLPFTLDVKRAAVELSITVKTLTAMIDAGLVWTVRIADRDLIPASEVRRLATIQKELVREAPLPRVIARARRKR